MKVVAVLVAIVLALPALGALAETPTPTPSPTPPVTTVQPFPSTPHYLRAFPGPEEDSWYIYASGFTPRQPYLVGEVACADLPCDEPIQSAVNDPVKEDGTMTFFVRLSHVQNASGNRLLAVVPGTLTGPGAMQGGESVPADAPTIRVAAHNPGRGLGYPKGTKTGIAPVDDVIALSQTLNSDAVRSRFVFREGTTLAGSPVTGIASWQCTPYIFSKDNLAQSEYPAGLVYAVFRVPSDPDLPLRYQDAKYGIAWWDGGAGTPLGGLTLVSDEGRIVGTEIRCGTTPGYHVHNFTDFILAPFDGPPAPTPTPGAPTTGDSIASPDSSSPPSALVVSLGALLVLGGAALMGRRLYRPSR
ncbi:MAG: hypothetical protein AB7N24_08975 [Dehalococcoidia bacterium]